MEEKYFIDFTGGFNDTVPLDNLAPNEMRDCENVIVSKTRGGILKRPGCTIVNQLAYSYNGAITQILEVRTKYTSYLYAIIKTGVNEHTLFNISGVKYPIKIGVGPKVAWVCYNDKLYFIDWSNNKYYEHSIGGSISEVTPDPDPTNDLTPIKRCKYLVWNQQSMRVFAAGDSQNPTALYYSEIGKPNYFKATSTRYPITSAGPIIGLKLVNDSILVAYENEWYHYTDGVFREDMTWKPMPVPFGAVSNDAITLTPETLTFLSKEALYIFSPSILSDNYTKAVGESSFADVSSGKIKNTILEMVVNKAKIIYFDKMVFIAYTNNADNDYCDKVLVMNWDTKTFTKFTGWKIYDWCVHNGGLHIASDNYILKYDHTGNVLSDIDTTTGEKKSIDMKVWTGSYNLSSFHNKTIYEMFISTEHKRSTPITNMVLTPDQNYANAVEFEIKNNVPGWVGGSVYANNKVQINRTGIRHRLYISDNNLDNYLFIAVIGFIYEYLTDMTSGEAAQELLISD